MNQKERKLVYRDIGGRLPYNIIVKSSQGDKYVIEMRNDRYLTLSSDKHLFAGGIFVEVDTIKPYLRSKSNMTEKEKKLYESYKDYVMNSDGTKKYFDSVVSIDYLNSIYVDYRGLIPLKLAIEAPEGMYKV